MSDIDIDIANPKQILDKLVQLEQRLIETWPVRAKLREALVSAINNPNIDTTCLNGFVSVQNRIAKDRLPELQELEQRLALTKAELAKQNAEEVYKAQLAVQEAEEHLASLLQSRETKQLEYEIALLRQDELAKGNSSSIRQSLVLRMSKFV